MTSRSVLAYAIVAAVLLCLLYQSSNSARSQETPIPVKYEYSVRDFAAPRGDDDDDYDKHLTGVMNQLADSGWEYVGPIAENTLYYGANGSRVSTRTYVAFRRPVSNQP